MNINLLGFRLRIDLPKNEDFNTNYLGNNSSFNSQDNSFLENKFLNGRTFNSNSELLTKFGLPDSSNIIQNFKQEFAGSYPLYVLNEPKFQELLKSYVGQINQKNSQEPLKTAEFLTTNIEFASSHQKLAIDSQSTQLHQPPIVNAFNPLVYFTNNFSKKLNNLNQKFFSSAPPIRRPYESTNLKGNTKIIESNKKNSGSNQSLLPRKAKP